MSLGNKIAQSTMRPLIDELILRGLSAKKIARHLYETGASDTFSEKTISDYRSNFFRTQDSPLMAVARVAQDLSDNDPPPTTNGEMLAAHFTFNSTKADLDLIYERIKVLRQQARDNPDEDQYDKLIQTYIDSAEKIRARVFKYQYEQIRRAVLVTVGKKICMAAVSIFLPYINKDKRKEAVERFESMITPLLGIRDLPSDFDVEQGEVVDPEESPRPPSPPAPKPPTPPAPPPVIPGHPELSEDFFMNPEEDGQEGA